MRDLNRRHRQVDCRRQWMSVGEQEIVSAGGRYFVAWYGMWMAGRRGRPKVFNRARGHALCGAENQGRNQQGDKLNPCRGHSSRS